MASLMLVKNLDRPQEAKPLLEKVIPRLTGEERSLADDLMREVG